MVMEQCEHWDDVFRAEFERESDRACVILAAAMLDQALETLLKAYLIPINKPDDELIDGTYAPLSTFDARINIAHRLGLISVNLCRDLRIIRKIRNDFAHNITGCTFNDSKVRSRVIELQRSLRLSERNPETRKTFVKGIKGEFQMVISWILWYLWSETGRIISIEPVAIEVPYWTKEEIEAMEALHQKKAEKPSKETGSKTNEKAQP